MERSSSQQHQWKRRVRRGAVAAAALFAALVAASAGGTAAAHAAEAIPAVPPSLAALYPPAAGEPVHLLAMLGLQDALSGIAADLIEGDEPGARAALAEFEERYRQSSGLVPEWRGAYPEEPLRELAAAFSAGDRAATMRSLEGVGRVCHGCHLVAMVPVQQRFRWGSFAAPVVRDALAGDAVPYREFKRRLATALTGVTRDVRQGQADAARRQFAAFSSRFDALRESCLACHATPRRAFVDRDVQSLIEELGRAVAAAAPDPQAVAGLSARIGRASCSPCHLVHVPAALAQDAHN